MRLHLTALLLALCLVSNGSAEDLSGTAKSAVGGAVGRDHVRSSSALEGRGSVRMPSRMNDGRQRDVGANFDSRAESRLSIRRGNGLSDSSIEADSNSKLGLRNQPRKRPPNTHSKPKYDYKGREEGTIEVNRHVLHADLQLAHRLAGIDRLRDHALAHDDVDLLMRADVLEHQARAHHQQHVEQMQFAAEQGNGVKKGFRANAEMDNDVEVSSRSNRDSQRREASLDSETRFDAAGASYEESETPEEPEQLEQDRSSDVERLDLDIRDENRSEASTSQRKRPRSRMPAPRETRVMADREFEAEFDAEYEAAVRPAKSSD